MDTIKSPEDLENYIHSRLVFPEEISILDSVWLDPVRLSTYTPEIGFSVSIDFGTQFDSDAYPCIIFLNIVIIFSLCLLVSSSWKLLLPI